MNSGYILSNKNGVVKGFALPENSTLYIEINGKIFTEIKNNIELPFTVQKELPKCAFDFDVKQSYRFHPNDKIKVLDRNKNYLPLSPNAFINKMKEPQIESAEKKYFFMHIPKTAGTTFRNILYNVFGEKYVYPNFKELILQNGVYLKNNEYKDKIDTLNHKKIFIGHLNFALIKDFKERPFTFGFMRNPYDQFCSNINHLKTKNKKYKKTSVEEIINKVLGNPQIRLIGKPKRREEEITNEDLEYAKNNLKMMDCIGITEHFEESVNHFCTTFNWEMPKIQRLNQAKKPYNFEVHKDLIESKIQFDKKLYEFALELFKKQSAK